MNEEEYKKVLEANGVDIPEIKKAPEKEEDDKKVDETEEKSEIKVESDEDKPKIEDEPKENRKRSIYDEYKEKKSELKSERELREQYEKENIELRERMVALEQAITPKEKAEAKDELEKFAEEINADPQAIKKMRELFLKDVKPEPDESLKKDLEDFKNWKIKNNQIIEKTMFEEEFSKTIPTLRELFPTMNDEELVNVKKEIDKLSHTKEWHDKELDYVIFKNKSTINALISPKKRGMESKSRKDVVEGENFEFNPDADYTKMTPRERELWENEYRKATTTDQLIINPNGKKILI